MLFYTDFSAVNSVVVYLPCLLVFCLGTLATAITQCVFIGLGVVNRKGKGRRQKKSIYIYIMIIKIIERKPEKKRMT